MRIQRLAEPLMVLVTACAILFFGFLAGSASIHFDGPFSEQMERTFKTLEQVPVPVKDEKYSWTLKTPGGVWTGAKPTLPEDWDNPPAPDTKPGVYVFDAAKVQPGLTLYAPVYAGNPIRLIDMQGNTIHQWSITGLAELPRDDDRTFARATKEVSSDVYLYPNGNLLVQISHDLGYPPLGLGLVMIDKDSKPIWSYMKQAHHQIDVAEDGRIVAMIGKMIEEKPAGLEKMETPYMDEDIVILSPNGKELAKASLLKSILNSDWQGMLLHIIPNLSNGDIFHLNSAKFLTADQAAGIPGAKSGDILLSLHMMDMLAVIDPYAEKIVWAKRGVWHRQHDPHVLANGNIMLFDNKGDLARNSRSRVIEFNPRTDEVVWSWPTDDSYDLYTAVNGSIQPLDNGNVLIAETSKGRLLEVTREGELVWQYQIPETSPYWDYTATKAWHAQRLNPDKLDFLQEH